MTVFCLRPFRDACRSDGAMMVPGGVMAVALYVLGFRGRLQFQDRV